MTLTLAIETGVLLLSLMLVFGWMMYRLAQIGKRIDKQGAELIEVQKVLIGIHRKSGSTDD